MAIYIRVTQRQHHSGTGFQPIKLLTPVFRKSAVSAMANWSRRIVCSRGVLGGPTGAVQQRGVSSAVDLAVGQLGLA